MRPVGPCRSTPGARTAFSRSCRAVVSRAGWVRCSLGTCQFCPVTDSSYRICCAGWTPPLIRWPALTIHCDDLPAVVVRRFATNRANFRSNEWEVIVTDGKSPPTNGKSPPTDGKCRSASSAARRDCAARGLETEASPSEMRRCSPAQEWHLPGSTLSLAGHSRMSSSTTRQLSLARTGHRRPDPHREPGRSRRPDTRR